MTSETTMTTPQMEGLKMNRKRDFGNEATNEAYDQYMSMSHEQLAVFVIRLRTAMGELEVNA